MSDPLQAPPRLDEDAPSWRRALAATSAALQARLGGERGQEALWLVQECSGLEAGRLWMSVDEPADPDGLARLRSMVARRCGGEPLAYVLGHGSFYGLELRVGPGVLVPRPETEVVVEAALAEAATVGRPGAPLVVADLGTGSAALALAVASAEPRARVWAVERSEQARRWAARNIRSHPTLADRVSLAAGSWFGGLGESLRGRIDLVVSNPPYVSAPEMALLGPEVASWEPHEALFGGSSGLDPLAEILSQCPHWLARPAAAVVEIAAERSAESLELARRAGASDARIAKDLAGRDRVLVTRWEP